MPPHERNLPCPISADLIVAEAEAAAAKLGQARAALGEVIFGQEIVLERALTTVLAGGHGLLVGVPGLAKTKLVDTMGVVLGLHAGRVQFTPDLMPSDILGSEILEEGADRTRSFRFVRGPDLRAAADGRRDQPRQPAHPVGAAAGHAGASRHHSRPAP
jgi:MoxR-like ATPase